MNGFDGIVRGMKIEAEMSLGPSEAAVLYDAAGWVAYTRDLEKLGRAFAGSSLILTARDGSGELVGLARVVSDGETICYVQDLLVRPDVQRSGVGRALMAELRRRHESCSFFVLTTDSAGSDDARKSHPFYRAVGLIPHEEQRLTAFGLPVAH